MGDEERNDNSRVDYPEEHANGKIHHHAEALGIFNLRLPGLAEYI